MTEVAIPFLAALSIFAAQGFVLLADEFVFHQRREVPRWERIGHPLDTVTVLAPLLVTVWLPVRAPWIAVFLGMAVLSCFFIAKDEWVHARLCSGGEQVLHALLFVLHPLLFVAAWSLWNEGQTGWLALQSWVVAAFMVYQIVYWNVVKRDSGWA